jgi:hypothetical protein
MRRRIEFAVRALCFALAAASCGGASLPDCLIQGERVHWIADYCMSKLQTDDEIAAGSCINTESDKRFRSECAAKLHYKRALCQLALELEARPGQIEQCVSDAGFVGSTVRNKGVGR